jgi:hypothetical protein
MLCSYAHRGLAMFAFCAPIYAQTPGTSEDIWGHQRRRRSLSTPQAGFGHALDMWDGETVARGRCEGLLGHIVVETIPISDRPYWGVPERPGIGVEIVPAKLMKYHELYQERRPIRALRSRVAGNGIVPIIPDRLPRSTPAFIDTGISEDLPLLLPAGMTA